MNKESRQKTIGVFFGSRSPEHDVSILTGELILSGLRNLGYQAVPVYIDTRGAWYVGGAMDSVEFFKKPERNFSSSKGYSLDLSRTGTLVFTRGSIRKQTIVVDCAFPAFHGQYGEDGTVQGLFEMMDVPYVGCDVVSSAMTMDKVLTLQMHQRIGLPVTPFAYFTRADWEEDRDAVLSRLHRDLRYPVFVKPARLGSSIGIARVSNDEDFKFAVDVALHYDEKVIVENGVENCVDVTCAVLGTDNPQASLLQETVFQDGFLSYDDKYIAKGGTQTGKATENIQIPARLYPQVTKTMQEYAVRAFKEFGCSGIARVDFLYDAKAKKIFVGEINTLPGAIYAHLWKASGVEFPELLSRLLAYAEERHAKKSAVAHTFDSPILRESNWSGKLRFLQEKEP